MEDYYFRLKGLCVGYNGKSIINDINIDIKKGEILTLIGPNGAGKSTILKSITRQLQRISGTVLMDNRDILDMSFKELSSNMAVVLTEKMKPELMTCHDVVATGRYPYTGRLGRLTKEDEKKVDEAIELVHAGGLGARDFNAISDGQRQRILLARAICQEPEIIVLDEPTSFLDVRYKLELLSILKNMANKKKITVIMSLHEIDLAMKISDKICCVKGDKIAKYGNPEDIFDAATIKELYEIDNGYFDPVFGSIELPKVQGEAEVFVISSGGSGIGVYRKLQKQNIAFSAGILYENDVDYQLAKLLAVNVITEKPFEKISDEAFEKAKKEIAKCKTVINAGVTIGSQNERIRKLLEKAQSMGKLKFSNL
ncbi:iron complex transport system ATP-binding protein [Acetitomaculum ruminis DSM 5522]|uniref:Iron complex transport system ATP-binding protein n=1 Tax=Acetitomaculum ruminis DSM 5522 TaxID=1120918 RepID=A0A1I0ZNN7_9FIRM|nr:ABC transporter ATP-binding protein [Acetitomaculum ruminis]SFB27419.1 iron complex transport system ATP-binding protein [Acetitomaculum ruminis DSM 5522]